VPGRITRRCLLCRAPTRPRGEPTQGAIQGAIPRRDPKRDQQGLLREPDDVRVRPSTGRGDSRTSLRPQRAPAAPSPSSNRPSAVVVGWRFYREGRSRRPLGDAMRVKREEFRPRSICAVCRNKKMRFSKTHEKTNGCETTGDHGEVLFVQHSSKNGSGTPRSGSSFVACAMCFANSIPATKGGIPTSSRLGRSL
jgi:hypothetical protein